MKTLDRPSTLSVSTSSEGAVQAVDFTAVPLSRRERVARLVLVGERLARATPHLLPLVQAGLMAAVLVGSFVAWIADVAGALRRIAMWGSIGLVFLVVGAYAALSRPAGTPSFEILPDPDFQPLPVPAPVSSTPPDAERTASAR